MHVRAGPSNLELWCWKLLRIPLDCKENKPANTKGNQPLNIHWKAYCWSWSSNTSATWQDKLIHWKRPWCWERLKVKWEGGDRMRRLDSITNSVDMNLSKLRETVEDRGAWCAWGHKELDMTWWLNNNKSLRVCVGGSGQGGNLIQTWSFQN